MPNSEIQPAAVEGHEGSPSTSPIYAYAIRADDLSDGLFLTSWEEDIAIENLPARFGASDPQTFTAAHVNHTRIRRRAEFDRHSFEIVAKFDTAGMPAYLITTPTTPMTVEIIRIAKGTIDDSSNAADFDVDCYVVQSGLIQNITLQGETVGINCVPQAFHMESTVPRLWFNRSCQWALYGTGCGLNRNSYDWETQITALSRETRTITLNGNPGGASDYFAGGLLQHNPTGQYFTALSATVTSGDTVIKLGHWSAELEIDDQMVLFPGCNRSLDHCQNKFGNQANFGGFSQLPDRNPTIHGV